jgi:hypothetical protein
MATSALTAFTVTLQYALSDSVYKTCCYVRRQSKVSAASIPYILVLDAAFNAAPRCAHGGPL